MPTALDLAANLTGASVTEGQAKTWFTAMRAALAEMGDPMARYGQLQNLSLVSSVAGNALTIALKNRAGADASADSPASFPFRNVTPATGDFSVLNLTAAHSLVVSSGSTLGAVSGVPFRLWVVVFNDGGTLRLGVINCLNGTNIFPLGQMPIASSTAEGGAGAADSAHVFYTGTAVGAKAYTVVGFLEWQTGLATAGTWNALPTIIQLFGQGVPLPGSPIQSAETATGAVATGTTVLPVDDTIPQNTEGNEYMTVAITPRAAANVLVVEASAAGLHSSASTTISHALFKDSVANALAAASTPNNALVSPAPLKYVALAGQVTSITFKYRAGLGTAGTITFNGASSARLFGGVLNSYLRAQEMQA